MVAMVGIFPGQGFTSWGSNPKCRILWLLFFFFYVNVDVVWTKNLWCEQRARLGFHMLGMKPDCKVLYFLFSFFFNLDVGWTKIPRCEQRVRWGGKDGIDIDNRARQQDLSKIFPFFCVFLFFCISNLFLILTIALVNETCQNFHPGQTEIIIINNNNMDLIWLLSFLRILGWKSQLHTNHSVQVVHFAISTDWKSQYIF